MRYLILTLLCFCIALTILAGGVYGNGIQSPLVPGNDSLVTAPSAAVTQHQPVSLHQFMQQHNITPGDNRLATNAPRRLSEAGMKGKRLVSTIAYDCDTACFDDHGNLSEINGNPNSMGGWLASINTNDEGGYVIHGLYGDYDFPLTLDLENRTASIQTALLYEKELRDTTVYVELLTEGMEGDSEIVGEVFEDGSIYFSDGFAIRISYHIASSEGDPIIYTGTVFRSTYLLTPNGVHKYSEKMKVKKGTVVRGSKPDAGGGEDTGSGYDKFIPTRDHGDISNSGWEAVKKPTRPIPGPRPLPTPTDTTHYHPHGTGTGTNTTGLDSQTGYTIQTYSYENPVYIYQSDTTVWIYGLFGLGNTNMNYMVLHDDGSMDFPYQQVGGYRSNYTTTQSTPSVTLGSLTPGNVGNWTPDAITWGKTVLYPVLNSIYYNNQLYYTNDYVNDGEFFCPSITVNPMSIDFGDVPLGETRTDTITVTGTNLVGNLNLKSTNHVFKVNNEKTITLTPNNGNINQQVVITYMPDSVCRNGGYVVITGAGVRDTVRLHGRCIQPPTITTSVSSLDFGTVVKGQTSSRTFTVRGINLTDDLTLSSNYTRFVVSPTIITKEDAANGVTVTVTYKPTAKANHTGQITISSPNAESKTVTLRGTCIAPAITSSSSTLDFGTVVKGNTSSKTFIVTGTDLTGSLSVTSNNSYFTVSPTTITAANAANGVTVTVTYKPTAVGTHSGTITISGGDAASKTVSVSGKCVVPAITTSPSTLAFGDVVKGNTVSKTFTVTGTDLTGPLSVTSNNSYFTVSPTTITAANAANGVTVTVKYKPTAVGSHSGTITISGGDAASKTISVTGKCVVPTITTSKTSLYFASNSSQTFTVTGTNLTGNLTLASSGAPFTVSPKSITPSQAAAGVTVTVTCNASLALQSASETITISGGGASSKTVNLIYDASGIEPRAGLVEPEGDSDGNNDEFINWNSQEVFENSMTDVHEMELNSKIYADGQSIIIDSPVEQRAIISDITGRTMTVSLQAGCNEIPVNATGIYIVRIREKTTKLVLR